MHLWVNHGIALFTFFLQKAIIDNQSMLMNTLKSSKAASQHEQSWSSHSLAIEHMCRYIPFDFRHVELEGTLQNELAAMHLLFSCTARVSAMIENNNNVYGPTPHIAETSPRGHPDLWRDFPHPPHAGEARRNPNCSAEAKK